jgi:hypothetical protein
MEQITTLLKVSFIVITILTVLQFYRASNKSKSFLKIIFAWMALQFVIVNLGFYANLDAIPPRLMLQLGPTLIFILILFLTVRGKNFIDSLNSKQLTLIHTVRIPVEIILFYLFLAKTIPQTMTFEGRNFDIIAGITAPIIFYFGFVKNTLSKAGILVWNVLSLGLLINIILIAVLSAKSPFQQFAFNETNIALGYFPFNWLPSVVVPIVLVSHLATLRQLIVKQKSKL